MNRRIAAIVLPQLGCELVRQRLPLDAPLGILFTRSGEASGDERDKATATLDLVDEAAWHYGVRPGQRVAEAMATLAELSIHAVTFEEIDAALGRVAEVALGLGTTAAIRLSPERADDDARRGPSGDAPFDTVWLDITGAAHLVGGEEALLDELCERVHALGHRVHAAIADGPRLARALARFAASDALRDHPGITTRNGPHTWIIATSGAGAALGPLPAHALPLDQDAVAFFGRLGVFTVADLARLPRATLAPRLGSRAAAVLELMAGRDPAPLVPYAPPRTLVEETSFEDPISSVEPLLFVLRAMTSRVAARLGARGEACLELLVTIPYDRSIARLKAPDREENTLSLRIELPAPLADAADLLRALKAKLERVELFAPATALRLEVAQIVEAPQVQIDLSRDKAVRPDALPSLLAELSADIGADRVGVLDIVDAHKPEARSRLVPVRDLANARRGGQIVEPPSEEAAQSLPIEPSRLLSTPIPLGRLSKGAVVAVDNRLYAIERLNFVMRLDGVEWWTANPASRDYAAAWLVAGPSPERVRPGGGSAVSAGQAWVFVDRTTGEGYLQGWCE
ncbi:DNA polymerase Y family protein [Polyangium aurulentum]|uniref:DNA polymerase Y family protein n=1 Tax=Polyangium aurulentum TaxID=2567896 RepID=UPI0010AE60DA|nr:DNA polymerase Y family protein [Polyangium aurulentum]UQA55818.1 DNA polymerase Y family protein [Polyangium aurulentum]